MVACERRREYFSLYGESSGIAEEIGCSEGRRGSEAPSVSPFITSASPMGSEDALNPAAACLILLQSHHYILVFLARPGRYAFMATTDAPKPTFAAMASTAARGQIGNEEGSRRNNMAETEPMAANIIKADFL